jgi:thymidylate synthase (FAD)
MRELNMKIIKPRWSWISKPPYGEALKVVELATRLCYKSENKIGDGTAEPLIRKIIQMGHHSVLEHVQLTARLITSRGISHELVRHRLCAFSQESTRYVDYEGKDMEFIQPSWVHDDCLATSLHQLRSLKECDYDFHMAPGADCYREFRWIRFIEEAEKQYKELRDQDLPPQFARGVLPNDLKTEMIMSANIRQWRHIFNLRVLNKTGRAHPDVVGLLLPMYEDLRCTYPVFFEDMEAKGV